MKKIAFPILFLLMLVSCGENKSEKLIGLWLLDQKDMLVYQGIGDLWRGELTAAEIYEKDGILFFDGDYTNTKDEHFVLVVSEEKISMQTFLGPVDIQLGEGGNTFALVSDVYTKITRGELERLIENEKVSKERLKGEFKVQQELARKKREAERMEKEEERVRSQAECIELKSRYKQSLEALSARLDYKAYKYNDPERKVVRDRHRAEKSVLRDEFESKKKSINNCW